MERGNDREDTPQEPIRRLLQKLLNLYPDKTGIVGPHVWYDYESGQYVINFPPRLPAEHAGNGHVPTRLNALSRYNEVRDLLSSLKIGTISEATILHAKGLPKNELHLVPEAGVPMEGLLRQAIERRTKETSLYTDQEYESLCGKLAALARRHVTKGNDAAFMGARRGEEGEIVVSYHGSWEENLEAISQFVRTLDGAGLIESPHPGKALINYRLAALSEPPLLPLNIGKNLVVDVDARVGSPEISFRLPKQKTVDQVVTELDRALADKGDESHALTREPSWLKREWKQDDPIMAYLTARFTEIPGFKNAEITCDAGGRHYEIHTGKDHLQMLMHLANLKDQESDHYGKFWATFSNPKDGNDYISTGADRVTDGYVIRINAENRDRLLAHLREKDPGFFNRFVPSPDKKDIRR